MSTKRKDQLLGKAKIEGLQKLMKNKKKMKGNEQKESLSRSKVKRKIEEIYESSLKNLRIEFGIDSWRNYTS